MKCILTAMLILASASVVAQEGPAQSMPTEQKALKDAEYALRRFEEVTPRIDWNRLKAPGNTIGQEQEVDVKMTQTRYVDEAKVLLKRFDGNKPTSSDLLDLTFDLERAAEALHTLSDDVAYFQDPEASVAESAQMNALAEELTRASSTTYEAMTEVYLMLRNNIGNEEVQRCTPLKKAVAPSQSR